MSKSGGYIEAALREHANGKVEPIGRPKIGIGRWVAFAAVAATTFSIAFASGSVISGTVDAPTNKASTPSLFHPTQRVAQPLPQAIPTPPPANAAPQASVGAENSEPSAPYMTEEFFGVAADAIRHNLGVDIDEATDIVDRMEDAGQHCVRLAEPGKRCFISTHGVVLNYGRGEYRVTYERFSKDGSVDLGDRRVGAIQKGDKVVVIADPHRRVFPVPAQGRP